MIFSKSKTMASKILAGFLALIMLVSVIPLGALVTAFATTIDSYTVSLSSLLPREKKSTHILFQI